ncbi:MAG: SAVED domain-containing protein [Proteobacteria bacterium]|nr:SAVED domain-containing protein [Pseudomonadota bacterium]
MGAKSQSPALSDAKSLGGVIAQDGFDYQLWDGLARLPAWLANPAFEELIFEGLEDLEARFFAPQAPRYRLLERYQAKSGNLAPKDVREVFATFQTFENAYPGLARMHTLVTPRLPATLNWLARDPGRVRKARPFYAPFADVTKASDDKLREDLAEEFGADLGQFIASSVEISERVIPDRDSGLHTFALFLTRTFEHITATSKQTEEAFEALSGLARKSQGVPLRRDVLIGQIESALGQALFTNPVPRIHVRSDRNEVDETALEIDASAFSGGSAPFPEPARWQDELITPMDHTGQWLRSRSVTRLAIGGSYRLTTAFSLGKAFRAASGFELEIEARSGIWLTDDRPRPDETYPTFAISEPASLVGDRLVVCVGILRDPTADLVASGVFQSNILGASMPVPVTSGRAAQAAVSVVKAAVSAAATRLKPAAIELYFAGPAAFAVALGHRWNAMPPTQLHEFIATDRRYVPTAFL